MTVACLLMAVAVFALGFVVGGAFASWSLSGQDIDL